MTVELLHTADGSQTILNKELNVTYHSTHGAVQESKHVYIDAGFKFVAERFKLVNVLEIGFGTGLNALLTYNKCQEKNIQVNYQTLEKFPLNQDTTRSLNYTEFDPQGVFEKFHSLEWNQLHEISKFFSFTKELVDVADYQAVSDIQLVYYDAFAPASAPEMWRKEIFERIFKAMVPGACLVTFCAKGDIKRMLKTCGFKVEALPGPVGKREMTRALKL